MKESGQSNDNVRIEKNLSDGELQYKLDLYSQGGEKQFFKIQRLKKSYLDQVREQQDIRSKVDINYSHGLRTQLPHSPHDSIKNYREEYDQKLRDQIVQEAKIEYRKHENLGKIFNGSKQPYEDKELSGGERITAINTYSSKSLIKRVFDEKGNDIGNMHRGKGLSKYFSSSSHGCKYSKSKTKEDRELNR